MLKPFLLPLGFSLLLAPGADAAELQIRKDVSVFAIVTHKAGLAKGKAHNHFVTAGDYTVRVQAEAGRMDTAVFEIELATEDLVIDDPDLQTKWYPRLAALGILALKP